MKLAALILYAAAGLGLRVPGDLSLLTIHDSPGTSTGRALDTMVLPGGRDGAHRGDAFARKDRRPDPAVAARCLARRVCAR